MSEELTLEGLTASLGVPASDPEPETDPTPETDPAPSATEPAADPAADPEPQPSQEPEIDKSQQAFIHMRQQNKKYADTLKGIANVLGIEGNNDEAALLAALQTKIAEKEAQQNNVPVELYQRLKQLEERDQEYSALQRQQMIAAGFETVKNTFNLTQQELNDFAGKLIEQGKNPLYTDLNLVNEYRVLNFDNLVQKSIESALAAERERAAKATNNSTNPSDQTGKAPETGDQKVTSVQGLENFFRTNMS